MKILLVSTLTALSASSLCISAQAQPLPIGEVFETVGTFLNPQCNDLVESKLVETITENRHEVHQSESTFQQDNLTHSSATQQQQNPVSIGQDCTAVANAYAQVINDYFQYLRNSQATENDRLRVQAEHEQQQLVQETQHLAQEQEQQRAITQQDTDRFDTLLTPFITPPEKPADSVDPSTIWPQPFFQFH